MSSPLKPLDHGCEIRDATAADLAAIVDIDASITGTKKPELWQGLMVEPWSEERGQDAKRSFLVARVNGQVVGYVVGEVRGWEFGSPPCGWLVTIGVRPDYRLSKIGSDLFAALNVRLKQHGIDTVRTMLHIDDHLLMSFFRAQGLTAGPFVELEMRLDADQ